MSIVLAGILEKCRENNSQIDARGAMLVHSNGVSEGGERNCISGGASQLDFDFRKVSGRRHTGKNSQTDRPRGGGNSQTIGANANPAVKVMQHDPAQEAVNSRPLTRWGHE